MCLQFITSNFPEVIRTEGFQGLSRELLDQVHFAMANRHYPDTEAKLKKEVHDGQPLERTAAKLGQLSLGNGSRRDWPQLALWADRGNVATSGCDDPK